MKLGRQLASAHRRAITPRWVVDLNKYNLHNDDDDEDNSNDVDRNTCTQTHTYAGQQQLIRPTMKVEKMEKAEPRLQQKHYQVGRVESCNITQKQHKSMDKQQH